MSVSLTVGGVFLEAYKKSNPNDTVTEINIYDSFVPEIDKNLLDSWNALAEGKKHESLSAEQQKQLTAFDAISEEFMNHDKYVFVTPLWNFMIPARLKSYIDALCVAGKTFKYTSNGPVGLLQGKKALHINSSGGLYKGSYADEYLRYTLKFIGIADYGSIIVEGHAHMPEKATEIIEKGKAHALEVAAKF